jgi:hypothetical protein
MRRAVKRWHAQQGIDHDQRMAAAGELVVAAMLGEDGDMPDHPR